MTGKRSGLALNELEVAINHVQREEVVVALKTEEEVVPVITNQEEALEALTVALLTTSLIGNKKSSPLIIVAIQRRLTILKPKR